MVYMYSKQKYADLKKTSNVTKYTNSHSTCKDKDDCFHGLCRTDHAFKLGHSLLREINYDYDMD